MKTFARRTVSDLLRGLADDIRWIDGHRGLVLGLVVLIVLIATA